MAQPLKFIVDNFPYCPVKQSITFSALQTCHPRVLPSLTAGKVQLRSRSNYFYCLEAMVFKTTKVGLHFVANTLLILTRRVQGFLGVMGKVFVLFFFLCLIIYENKLFLLHLPILECISIDKSTQGHVKRAGLWQGDKEDAPLCKL